MMFALHGIGMFQGANIVQYRKVLTAQVVQVELGLPRKYFD